MKQKYAVVAMSGGVDSSVAALLLAKAGYKVVGVTMRLFANPFDGSETGGRSCCSTDDVNDARAVCRIIGARHLYLNFEKEFEEHVISYFVDEYQKGRTPHPCVACNDKMKFDFLMKRAALMNADVVATGHYARIKQSADNRFLLLKGKDATKDQSYVLFGLNQNQMRKILLPIGEFTKEGIREVARSERLPVADKPDSQDICFVPFGNYREFIEERVKTSTPGEVVDSNGKVLGMHSGVHNFTIGQRKGLPLASNSSRPVYVTAINPSNGRVTVGHAESLLSREALVGKVNWLDGEPKGKLHASVRIRYNGREERALVEPMPNGSAKILFDSQMRAVTPGQPAVFYQGDVLLGGGLLEPAPDTAFEKLLPPDKATIAA